MNFLFADPSSVVILTDSLSNLRDVKIFLFSEDACYTAEPLCLACLYAGSHPVFRWVNVRRKGCGPLLRKLIIWSTHRSDAAHSSSGSEGPTWSCSTGQTAELVRGRTHFQADASATDKASRRRAGWARRMRLALGTLTLKGSMS